MVGEIAQSTRGVHHQARSCLNNSGEVIAGVRRSAELLLIESCGDVSIFRLQQRLSPTLYVHRHRGSADGELNIAGGDLSQRDGEYLLRFLETGGRHRHGVAARIQELKVVYAIL